MLNLSNTFCASVSQPVRVRVIFAALAFLFCLSAAENTFAVNFVVTRTDDRNVACVTGVDCSLREAVNAANLAPTNDTINFAIPASDPNCPSGVCTITLTLGEIVINDAATAGTLTITNSTGASNLLISGNNTSRVFFVNSGANLTISGVTITKGNGTGTTNSGDGGGIFNLSGTLILINSIVSGNMASSRAGGIYNNLSTTTLTNSTVSDNTASINGGGIFNFGGMSTLTNSTVSGNSASYGGGIYNFGGTATLTNSTVSGNSASFDGGINNSSGGTLNLTSGTVTQNKSTDASCTICAGGIHNFATANLKNTIVAGNTVANASAPPDFGGAVAAGSSYNLIGNGQGTTGISNGDANSNQVGVDPLLDPTLQLNGGTTANHALLAGSPAIDKGNSFGLTTDQRGFTRPIDNPSIPNATGGDGADIGAFEVQAGTTAASVSISGRVMTASGRGIRNVRITLIDSEGNTRTAFTTAFGYYRFADVAAGQTYVIKATAKRFTFNTPTLVVNTGQDLTEINFTALPQMFLFSKGFTYS